MSGLEKHDKKSNLYSRTGDKNVYNMNSLLKKSRL